MHIPCLYHAYTDRKLGRPSELWHCALPGLVEGGEGGGDAAAAPPRRSFEVRALVLLEEQLPEARRHCRRPCHSYCPLHSPCPPTQPPQRPFYCSLGARPLAAAAGQPAAAEQERVGVLLR